MKKVLIEYGRLEEEQMSFLDSFFLSSSVNERTDPEMEGEDGDDEDGGDDDDDNDSRFQSTEEEAGVISWTEASIKDEGNNIETKDKAVRRNHKWLQSSLIATAGKGDIIVLALAQKIAVLENNGSSDAIYEVIGQFSIVTCGQNYDSVYIRSMCVIPLAVTRTTETKDYDFIAIAVGLSNGYVLFFTERGVLLRSELFSENPIDNVRFGRSVLPGEQELVILASGRMTIVDGLSLHVALRTAKIQIARGEDDIQKIAAKALLNVEKIKLAQKIAVTDLAVLGPYEQPYVETYAAASVSVAGPKACVTSLAPPIYTTYMFTGKSPYVAFGWNRFGEAPPNLISEIMYNYGAELMSNVVASLPKFGFGSLFGSKGDTSVQTQRNKATENRALASRISTRLEMRSMFEDDGREGERLFPAPYGSPFVAVTDSIARVILFDTNMRQVRRVWKGYRDARCAWIEVATTVDVKRKARALSESTKKKTLLLVLFAPRRGLLEVWLPLNGKRIAAVNVEKNGRLISSFKARDYTLGNLTLVEDSAASAFFLSSDGKFYKIEVPFYLTLLHESTVTIHDENVLKEVRQLNNNIVLNGSQVNHLTNLLCTLKTPNILREALDITLKNRNISVNQYLQILTALSKCVETEVCRKSTADNLSLRKYVAVVSHLLNVYSCLQVYHHLEDGTWLTTTSKDTTDASVLVSEITENEMLRNKLRLSSQLLEACLKQIFACQKEVEEMKFLDFPFSDFLNSFDFSLATSLRHSSVESQDITTLLSSFEISVKKMSPLLGFIIFAPALKGICSLADFNSKIIKRIGLSQLDLLDIFCSFWLTEFGRITIFQLSDVLLLCHYLITESCDPSHCIKLIEGRLYSCNDIASTFSLCLIARAIEFNNESYKELEVKEMHDNDVNRSKIGLEKDWEKVEYSLEKWDFLIKNLLCMSILKCLPHSPIISLQEFLNSGKAFYREKLGLWVAVHKPEVSAFNEVVTNNQLDPSLQNVENELWVKPLRQFLQFFPFSMRAEFILCDCAWECVNNWKRDIGKNVDGLKYAMKFISLLHGTQHLQQAICCLLWETHLKEPLKALFEWLNKTGKSPRERHARKHVGIGENQLSDFVMCCADILRILQTSADGLDFVVPEVKYEDFVEAFFDFHKKAKKSTRETLISVLSRQNLPVYDLVVHHYDLACVLELQLALSMRLHPFELFDDELALKALFVPLSRQQTVPIYDVVASLRRRRQNFVETCTALITESHRSSSVLYEIVDSLVHDWALDMDGVSLKEMEGLLILGDQEGTLRCMYRVRFPELVVERCYPYLLARLRLYIKEYCPDLIGIAKRQGQWPKWAQTALQTSCGENVTLVRAPTFKEMEDFVNVLQDFSNRISSSTDELLIKIRVLKDIAKILKCLPD